jgi:hypothetical protein
MLKITQAAMNQLRRSRRSAGREIVHLGKRYRIAPPDGVSGDAATVDPATDNKKIVDHLAIAPS